jgi:large subunit ribosomal protein L9
MKQKRKQSLLLIEDVYNVGRSGDIVKVKPGYARNFLLPQKKAVFADKNIFRIQEKLLAKRAQKSAIDKQASEDVKKRLEALVITTEVKVDPEGKLYGSVGPNDIVSMLEKQGVGVEKASVQLKKSIKDVGVHEIHLKLKEGVVATFTLKIIAEGAVEKEIEEKLDTEKKDSDSKA